MEAGISVCIFYNFELPYAQMWLITVTMEVVKNEWHKIQWISLGECSSDLTVSICRDCLFPVHLRTYQLLDLSPFLLTLFFHCWLFNPCLSRITPLTPISSFWKHPKHSWLQICVVSPLCCPSGKSPFF